MALAARAPDIILRNSIPLEATSDQPLIEAVRPPESASNDAADQAAGTPKEITPEEQAAALAARKAPEPANSPGAKVEATPDAEADDATDPKAAPPKLEFDEIDPKLPGFAIREITKHRKQAQARADAAWKAAQASVGDDAWTRAVEVSRDALVEAARKEAKTERDAKSALEKELADLKAKVPEPVNAKPAEDPRPARDQFDDPDAYDTALTDWATREGERKAEQRVAEARAAEEAETTRRANEETQAARQAEIDAAHTEWQSRRTAAVEKYPDYAEVAEADPKEGGPNISDAMAAAIMQAENGPEIAYHLGQNTDEALRIASIPNPFKQMLEMGRLAERLAAPPRRAPRPRPLEPIDASDNRADSRDAEPDMEAWAARRNGELRAARAPFFPPGGVH